MKTLKYTLLAALSIFAAASCTKESTGDIQQPSAGVDVKAVFEDDMSKALLQSNGGLQWENGDQIAVYQFHKYTATDTRDKTKNIFTSDGTCLFSGEIANYQPLGEGGTTNRYVAAYPADRWNSYGISTGKATVTIPSVQTGLLSDFKKNAMYFAYMSESSSTVSYDADNAVLTFLEPFNLFCIIPILKFNVPENLNVSKIVLSAENADKADVMISGKISDFKPYSAGAVTTTDASPEITIENGGSVLAGDIYVALAPDLEVNGGSHPQFKSSAKTLTLSLSTPQGATATLQLPLNGEILAGTIKNLPSLPSTVDWKLQIGPGISSIGVNKEKITTDSSSHNAYTRILLTPEDSESVIKYKTRTSLSEAMLTTPNNICGDAGIARQDADTPENYIKLCVSTEGYADYNAYACTWIINKNYGFGKAMYDEMVSSSPIAGETTYPTDGSYKYNLNFLYRNAPTNTESTNKIPQINSDGFYLYPSESSSKTSFWEGVLRVKSPASGSARLIFDSYVSKNTQRVITISRDNTTIEDISTGAKPATSESRIIQSQVFDISVDDILEISVSKTLLFYSITLLWEPTETEASLATESYASKTSYGN